MGRNLKRCQYHFDGDRIESLKVTKYRDTRGVGVDEYNKVFDVIDTICAKGKRDYALFLLLWANVLRRGEVAKLRVGDFDYHENTLTVYGKGKGNDSTRIDLNPFVAEASPKNCISWVKFPKYYVSHTNLWLQQWQTDISGSISK
ncbi:tyrosine-type recombinase/integrase [Scytonema sp. PCC 10023]|uniref:tyrosine-type recombinase/integrase n=1 Tax=Scytonema sp. PCC 10023 TaxID=1680591 RepID=UPI0039C73B1B